MNKSLVDNISNEDFKNYVKESVSINDLARKIGYAHSPGHSTRNKLKERMIELNLGFVLEPTRDNENHRIKIEGFNTKDIGDIGEAHFQLAALKHGLVISKVIGDNKPYEFILDLGGPLYKIQVKTTTSSGDTCTFDISSTYRINGEYTRRIYTDDMIDYFYLYNMVKDEAYLIKPNGQSSITLRFNKSRQYKNMNYAEELLFEKIIEKLKED